MGPIFTYVIIYNNMYTSIYYSNICMISKLSKLYITGYYSFWSCFLEENNVLNVRCCILAWHIINHFMCVFIFSLFVVNNSWMYSSIL